MTLTLGLRKGCQNVSPVMKLISAKYHVSITNSFLLRAKNIFSYYGPLQCHFWSHIACFRTWPRFWPKQCFYQVWKESVKKCGLYCVYWWPGLLDKEIAYHDLDLGVKVTERSPRIFPALKLDWPNIKFVLQIVFFREQKQNSAAAEMDQILHILKHAHFPK